MTEIEKAMHEIMRRSIYIVRPTHMANWEHEPNTSHCCVCDVLFSEGYYVLQPLTSNVFVCSTTCADMWILQHV